MIFIRFEIHEILKGQIWLYMYYLRLRKKFDPIAYCANIEMISALQYFPSKHNSVKLLLLISYIVFLGLCAYLLFYTENRDYGLLTREKKIDKRICPHVLRH